ncbi:MAG TPA: type II secretion system protein [Solirubrobacteraceae bacterium]|nr:type II secretion system protein [Solirubrobacteraceae bacterium]
MRCTRRLRDERGMTLIELLVAAVICATGIMATIAVMDQSRKVAVKAEHREAMAHQAQREAERLMELPWANFRHASTPTTTSTPAGNPSTWISDGSFAYDRKNPTVLETLSVDPGNGQVPSTSTTWDDGQTRLTGRLYRYVTTIDANSRRLTVVATGDGLEPPAPVIVSSIKTKPLL